MFQLPAALKAKGEQAEADFREWLNRSGVAYMYVEQSPLTVPAGLRGRIKRPDYLVGIPHAGMIAFDVKAKSLSDGHLVFNAAELEKQQRFARLFNLTIYLACLNLDRPGHQWWLSLSDLLHIAPQWRGKQRVIAVDVASALSADTTETPFLTAFMSFIRAAMDADLVK